MDKRWFLLLALSAFLALGYGYPQLAALITGLFVISGIGYLINRFDEKRLGKRTVTVRAPKTTPPQ